MTWCRGRHRRQIARSWRGDSPELLAGASLVLSGPSGLTLILAGGPPPRRITIRAATKGNPGLRLRRSAEALKIPQVDAPDLARRLAQRPAVGIVPHRRAGRRARRDLAGTLMWNDCPKLFSLCPVAAGRGHQVLA